MAEIPEGSRLDPTTALLQAASDALQELGISDPGGTAASMIFSAAFFSPDDDRPEISTTRLLAGAVAFGQSYYDKGSYAAAMAAAVTTDANLRDSYQKCLSLFHQEPAEAALKRLQKKWFSPNVELILREAANTRADAPLADAIVRTLLKFNAGLARTRIDMNRLAERVEAIRAERQSAGPTASAQQTIMDEIKARLADLKIEVVDSVLQLLLRATGYREKGDIEHSEKDALHIEHVLLALTETKAADQWTPTSPSAMFRAAFASDARVPKAINPERPANPSDPLHFSLRLADLLQRALDLQRGIFLNAKLGTKGLVAALLTTAQSEVRRTFGEGMNPDLDGHPFRAIVRNRLADKPAELQQWLRALALENAGLAQLNNDQPSSGPPKDMLGITNDARAIANVAAGKSTNLPLAFGIFGDWGAGKSFFMRLLQEQIGSLVKSKATDDGFEHAIVQIQFNAWHYAETNLWASLVGHIFDELDRWMTKPEEGKEADTKMADQILQRLATSRQLTLEAAGELVQRRKEHRKAGFQLADAEKKLEAAKDAAAHAPLIVWRGAIKFALDAIGSDTELKEHLGSVRTQLGLSQMVDDKNKIVAALGELDRSVSAGRAALGGLRATIGNGPTAVYAIAALIGVPALIYLIEIALVTVTKQPEWKELIHGFEALGGVLGMLCVLVKKFSTEIKGIVAKFSGLKDRIDEKIAEATQAEQEEAKAAAGQLARSSAEVERAKTLVHATGEQVAAALKEYAEETGAARIQRFVRARAGVEGYGKHLGLVSTIRKDFEQLESLMLRNEGRPKGDPAQPPEHLEQAREHYEVRVRALLREAGVRLPDKKPSAAAVAAAVEKDAANNAIVTAVPVGETEQKSATLASVAFEKDAVLDADEVWTLLDSTKSLRELKMPEAMEFRRIVLYIDDLDRCEPAKVIEVLQAVNMLLSFRLFVVMVAVDARWLLRSLEVHYPDVLRTLDKTDKAPRVEARPAAEDGKPPTKPDSNAGADVGVSAANGNKGQFIGTRASPADYLEKIFQIPYWVPAMGEESSKALVSDLVAPDRATGGADAPTPQPPPQMPPPPRPGEKGPEPEDEQAPTEKPQSRALGLTLDETTTLEALAPYLGGSPRRARRFVNVYRVAKTSLTPAEIKKLEEGEHRALATQLAIATGAPNGFSAWVSACGSVAGKPEEVDSRILGFAVDDAERSNIQGAWQAFRDMVKKAEKEPGDVDVLQLLADQARRAERFSFAVPDKRPSALPPGQ